MLMRKGKPYMLALAVLLVVSAVSATLSGLEYAVLCLMIIFIAAPMLAAWLYFSEGLRPENVVNILPHTLAFRQGEIIASVNRSYPSEPSSEPSDSSSAEKPDRVIYRFPIPSGTRYSVLSDGVILPVSLEKEAVNSPKGILWIPLEAFESPRQMKEALELIS